MTNTPINYNTWDRSGKGKNILHLLTPVERKIWDAELPYQDDLPNDRGHILDVTSFALQLLKLIPSTDRTIVIPPTILHDIGWSQVSQKLRDLFKDPYHPDFKKANDPTIRQKHQDESVKLATKILGKYRYPKSYHAEILAIVGDHDT